MRKYFFWWGILYGITLLLACQAKTQDATVIAKVGGEEITYDDIDTTFFGWLEYFEDSLAQKETALKYLDSLVNQKLLIRAAYQAKLDQNREINILVDEQKSRFLIDELYKMEILEKSVPSTEELKDFYKKSGEQRKIKHILVKDKSEADQIYKELKKGGDFDKLAKEKSIDPGSKDIGGDLGMVGWGGMAEAFQQQAWKMKAGQISKPVETNFGWHIIRVDEVKKLEQRPFQELAEIQKQRIQFSKQSRLTQEFLDQLRSKAEVKMETTTYQLMLERDSAEAKKDILSSSPKPSGSYLRPEAFSESERNLPLLTYNGGNITLGEFLLNYAKIPPFQRGTFSDFGRIQQFSFQMAMGDLLEKEAQDRKVESRPGFKSNILKLKETLMADKMRNDLVMQDIKVTDEDLHNYYDSHLQEFQIPENVKIQEILVSTKEEAAKLVKQIKAGANMGKLAAQHTLRPTMKEKAGILDSLTQARIPELFEAVKNAKRGELLGPVPFKNNFSVIRLLERRPLKQLTLAEAQAKLRASAYQEKRRTTFQNWINARKQIDPTDVNTELYLVKIEEKLAQRLAANPGGQKKKITGQFPMKIKVGKDGQIEKVED